MRGDKIGVAQSLRQSRKLGGLARSGRAFAASAAQEIAPASRHPEGTPGLLPRELTTIMIRFKYTLVIILTLNLCLFQCRRSTRRGERSSAFMALKWSFSVRRDGRVVVAKSIGRVWGRGADKRTVGAQKAI